MVRSLETNVRDKNKMGIRSRRVRLQSLDGVGSPGQEYQSQLDRFLIKLIQADERLIGSSAGHRIQVVDCRIGVAGEVRMDAATNGIYRRLSALLMQTDPWQVRLETLEEFVRTYQRLPRQRAKDSFEPRLGNWWLSQYTSLRLGRLPAHRLQKAAVDISCFDSATGGEVVGWGRDAIFRQKCQGPAEAHAKAQPTSLSQFP